MTNIRSQARKTTRLCVSAAVTGALLMAFQTKPLSADAGVIEASPTTPAETTDRLVEPGKQPSHPLLAARFAGVEGRFEDCARLADEARRRADAYWRAHHVYATCETFAADAARERIGEEKYAARIRKAIDAFQFLLQTPGVVVASDRRRSISFMIDELEKRISRELKETADQSGDQTK